jgi:hypothetical protein
MVNLAFEIDPRDAERLVCNLPPRQELIYRLAVRGLCPLVPLRQ